MLVLGIIMFKLEPKFLNVKINDLKHFAVIGFVMAAAISCYVTAFFFAPVANVVLLDYLYPIFIIPLGAAFLKEKTTKNELLALVLSLIALLIINPLSKSYMIGNMLAVLSGIGMAVLIILMRYENRTHKISSVFWFMFFATLFMLPFPFIFGIGNFVVKAHWIILLGAVSTGLSMLFLNYGLERLNAETVAVIDLTLVPLLSIVLAIIILSQIPKLNVLVGGVILIGSAVILKVQKPHGVLKKKKA